MLISKHNMKLGIIPSFSLPVLDTCPGRTSFCEEYCYGLRGQFGIQNVRDADERRLEYSLRNDFVGIMVMGIRRAQMPAFRLHVIGDFYNAQYIEKWIEIVGELPYVAFFGSTRSWRCRQLAEPMKRFRDMNNVFLRASTDFTDPQDPVLCGWRVWSVGGEGVPCPHDQRKVSSCFVCRRCWTKKEIDVRFKLK